MDARLTLEIPASVTTRFLVATDEPVTPGTDHLREALTGTGLARTARDLLGSPLLTIDEGRDAPTPWSARLHWLGGSAEGLRKVMTARRHVVVTAVAAPGAQPRHAQAARLVARKLAAATSGLVVDLDSNQVLARDDGPPAEPERFLLGRQWVGVFIAIDGERRVRADTAGLHRFGLPELVARHVPYAQMLTAANLLRALAHRLFTEHSERLAGRLRAPSWEIAANEEVSAADVLSFWGATRPDSTTRSDGAVPPGSAGRSGGVAHSDGSGRPGGAACPGGVAGLGDAGRLSLRLALATGACPECVTALEVLPPEGRGDAGWWNGRAAEVMPKMVSAPPG